MSFTDTGSEKVMTSLRPLISALVVSRTPHGTYYLHDGNHRYFALREHFGARVWDLPVRVAVLTPTAGYQWHYQWFGTYGTWLLKPARPWPEDYARGWSSQVLYLPGEVCTDAPYPPRWFA